MKYYKCINKSFSQGLVKGEIYEGEEGIYNNIRYVEINGNKYSFDRFKDITKKHMKKIRKLKLKRILKIKKVRKTK